MRLSPRFWLLPKPNRMQMKLPANLLWMYAWFAYSSLFSAERRVSTGRYLWLSHGEQVTKATLLTDSSHSLMQSKYSHYCNRRNVYTRTPCPIIMIKRWLIFHPKMQKIVGRWMTPLRIFRLTFMFIKFSSELNTWWILWVSF